MDRYEDYIQQVGYEQAQSDGVITMAEQDNYIEWYTTYQQEEEYNIIEEMSYDINS